MCACVALILDSVCYARQEEALYDQKYKAIGIVLLTLARALDGGYVNFGVFSLYVGEACGALARGVMG